MHFWNEERAMSAITILSKQPPGGRCSLYMRYAEALRQTLGFQHEVRYCDSSAAVPPVTVTAWPGARPAVLVTVMTLLPDVSETPPV